MFHGWVNFSYRHISACHDSSRNHRQYILKRYECSLYSDSIPLFFYHWAHCFFFTHSLFENLKNLNCTVTFLKQNATLWLKDDVYCTFCVKQSARGVLVGRQSAVGRLPASSGSGHMNISVNAVRQMSLASERCLPRAEWHFLGTIWDCSDIENTSRHTAAPFPLSSPPSLHPPSILHSLPLLISLVLSAAAFCLFILLQVRRFDKVPKAWWRSTGERNGWKCEWVQQRKMITDRKDTQHRPSTFCGKLHVVTKIQTQKRELKSKRISERPETLSMFWFSFVEIWGCCLFHRFAE